MATGKQIQKKGSSHFTPTPATGMFKPRPFAEPAQPEAATPEIQTKVELGNIGGDRLAGMQVLPPPPIQAKLAIGAPGDKYEQEADTIARKVVKQISAPTPPDANPSGDEGLVQRQFSAPSISRLVVQRQEAIEGGQASSSLESSINQAKNSGVPLAAPIRRQMEGAFGADFSGVRIHANNTADTLNRDLTSRAFTTGNNIFFKRGEYDPGSSAGKELLAHELTHVVQQGGGSDGQIQRLISVKDFEENTDLKTALKFIKDAVQPLINALTAYHQAKSADERRKQLESIIAHCKALDKNIQVRGMIKLQIRSVLQYAEDELESSQTPTKEVQDIINQTNNKVGNFFKTKTSKKQQVEWFFNYDEAKNYYQVAFQGKYAPHMMIVDPTKPKVIIVGQGEFLNQGKGCYFVLEDFIDTSENSMDNRLFWLQKSCFEEAGFHQAQSKEVQADPELSKEDIGKFYKVKDGKEAQIIEQGEISSRFYTGPLLVENVVELSREYFIFPGDKKAYTEPSIEGSVYNPFGENLKGKIIVENNGFAQCKLEGYSGEFWVQKQDLIATKEDGYKCNFKNGSKIVDVWVAKNDLEQSEAGFTDKSQESLFPEDPKPDHVLQGGLGDCYLLAALASLAKTEPNYIKGMMKDNQDAAKDGKGGTVTVRLYDVTDSYDVQKNGSYYDKEFQAKPLYIKINKSVAQKNGKDLYSQKYLWVQMIEKAYSASGISGNLTKIKPGVIASYDNIKGGMSWFAWEVLTGKKSSSITVGTGSKQEKILQQIKDALDAGKAVGAGTRALTGAEEKEAASEGVGHSGGEAKLKGIVATHAYSILDVKVKEEKILLRNPWGKYGVKYENEEQTADQDNGTFWLKASDFFHRFTNLDISGKVETF